MLIPQIYYILGLYVYLCFIRKHSISKSPRTNICPVENACILHALMYLLIHQVSAGPAYQGPAYIFPSLTYLQGKNYCCPLQKKKGEGCTAKK